MTKRTHTNALSKKRKVYWILGIVLGILIVFRLTLPYFVLKYVNGALANIKEYYGHVDDIDIALLRGAYVIKDLKLVKVDKTNKQDSIPFCIAPKIDLSIAWNALFKGSIVGEIYAESPILNFVKGKHKGEDLKADTADFKEVIKKLMPLKVNHFEASHGEIHYIDRNISPILDISLNDVKIVATNLSNVNDSSKLLPAKLQATGHAYEGVFELTADFNPLEREPTFDINARLNNVNLPQLNNFFKAYVNLDVSKGNFGLYTEFAAKDGNFKGYVKPVIKDLKVLDLNKEKGNIGQILWEAVIGTVAQIFKNQPKDQLATKIPIEGKFDNPERGLWTAITYLLRNAFVSALTPSIDNTVTIEKVSEKDTKKTFLEKIFKKKANKKK